MSSGSTTQFIFAPDVKPDNRKYLLMLAAAFWTICLGCTILSIGVDVLMGGVRGIIAAPFILAVALVPNVAIAFLLPRLQRFQRSHRYVLVSAFLAGAIIAIPPALVINTSLFLPIQLAQSDLAELIGYGTIAGVVEEGIKGLIVVCWFWRFRDEFHDQVDGVVLGALVGLGFAMTEDITYFLKGLDSGIFGLLVTIFLRLGLGWMNHSVFTAITGLAVGFARMGPSGPRRWLLPLGGYVVAATLHNTFNFLATILERTMPSGLLGLVLTIVPLYGLTWTAMAFIGFLVVRGWHQEATLMRVALQDEVDQQTVTTYEYLALPSPGQRRLLLRDLQQRAGKGARQLLDRVFQLQMALAFQKHHTANSMAPLVPQLHSEAALRARLAALRPQLSAFYQALPVGPGVAPVQSPPPPLYPPPGGKQPPPPPHAVVQSAAPRRYRLVVTAGAPPGTVVELRHGLTIGRVADRAEFVLPDPEVSGLHARIDVVAGVPVLVDAESLNGTYVNGTRIARWPLEPGDRVQLGDVQLVVEAG